MQDEKTTLTRDEAESLSDYIMLDSRRYDNNVRGE